MFDVQMFYFFVMSRELKHKHDFYSSSGGSSTESVEKAEVGGGEVRETSEL